MFNELNVYIGYDQREREAFNACRKSIHQHSGSWLTTKTLEIEALKKAGYYNRGKYFPDETVATDFAFTRFLVPFLNDYKGWAVFCDCDFIFTKDIGELFDLADEKYAVMCVKHDYTPNCTVKMDNQVQLPFPRKNWSSMMLFNCEHPDCRLLNVNNVARQDAAWLHQMKWTPDEHIGSLPLEWNWLVGEYSKESLGGTTPAVLHYTLGCPFMPGYENCDFAEEYNKYAK